MEIKDDFNNLLENLFPHYNNFISVYKLNLGLDFADRFSIVRLKAIRFDNNAQFKKDKQK